MKNGNQRFNASGEADFIATHAELGGTNLKDASDRFRADTEQPNMTTSKMKEFVNDINARMSSLRLGNPSLPSVEIFDSSGLGVADSLRLASPKAESVLGTSAKSPE